MDYLQTEILELQEEIDHLNMVLQEKSQQEDRLLAKNNRLLAQNNQLFKQIAEYQRELGDLHQQLFSLRKGSSSGGKAELNQLQQALDRQKSREHELLQINADLQKQLADFHASSSAQESSDSELIDLKSRLNDLDTVYEKAIVEIKRLRNERDGLQQANQEKDDQLAAQHAETSQLKDDVAQLESIIPALQTEVERLRLQLSEPSDHSLLEQEDSAQLETENEWLKQEYQTFQKRLQTEIAARMEAELRYREAEGEKEQLSKQLEDITHKVEKLGLVDKDEITAREQERADWQTEKEQLQKKLAVSGAEINDLQAKVTDLHIQLTHNNALAQKYNALLAEHTDLSRKFDKASSQISTLEDELASHPDEIESLQRQLAEMDSLMVENQRLQAQIDSQQITNDSLRQQLDEMSEKLAQSRVDADAVETLRNQQLEQDLNHAQAEIAKLNKNLNKTMAKRVAAERDFESLSDDVEQLKISLAKSTGTVNRLLAEKDDFQHRHDSLFRELRVITERLITPAPKKEKKPPVFWMMTTVVFFLTVLGLLLLQQSLPFGGWGVGFWGDRAESPSNSSPTSIQSPPVIVEQPLPPVATDSLPSEIEDGRGGLREWDDIQIAFSPSEPKTAPLPVTFGVDLPETISVFYDWDFGDGTTSTDSAPIHTYLDAGVYPVQLTLRNAIGDTIIGKTEVVVESPLLAVVTPSDPDDELPPPTQPFSDEASQTKTETQRSGKTKTSPMISQASEPRLSVSADQGRVPLTVNFSVEGLSDDNHYGFLWNFGDGGTSSRSSSPSHTYQVPGEYRAFGIIKSNGVVIAELSRMIKVLPNNRGIRIQQYNYTEEMILVPAGNFVMGDSRGERDARPPINVFLDTYYIDKFEVTNQQYAGFLNDIDYESNNTQYIDLTNLACRIYDDHGTYKVEYGYENYPVVCVSWYGAKAYANALGKDLPTEAEWEKAARSDQDRRQYCWGDHWLAGAANIRESSRNNHPSQVGRFPLGKSPYGCFDMVGNVSEWCLDWYDENYYKNHSGVNPFGAAQGVMRSYRGGSYVDDLSYVRVFDRSASSPTAKHPTRGFRCVKRLGK